VNLGVPDETALTSAASEPSGIGIYTETQPSTNVSSGSSKEPQGIHEVLSECTQCGLATKVGAIDDVDGLWYCKTCWDALAGCAECGQAEKIGAFDEADGLWYCKACWEALLSPNVQMREEEHPSTPECWDASSQSSDIPEKEHPSTSEDLQSAAYQVSPSTCTPRSETNMRICTSSSIIEWLQDELSAALDNESAVESLMSWAEVLLTDYNEGSLAQLETMFSDEAVPHEIIRQLSARLASTRMLGRICQQ